MDDRERTRVAVISGDPPVREQVKGALRRPGWEIRDYESPEAVSAVRGDCSPDVWVLDTDTSIEPGRPPSIQDLSEQFPDSFFLGLREEGTNGKESLLDSPVVRWFTKPVSPKRLSRTVGHLSYFVRRRKQTGDSTPSGPTREQAALRRSIAMGVLVVVSLILIGFGYATVSNWVTDLLLTPVTVEIRAGVAP